MFLLKTKEQLIRTLAKLYGVKVRFYDSSPSWPSGQYIIMTQTIMVSRCRKDAMLSIFFHELGHKHCHDMGIWRWYHTRYMRNGRYWYTKKLLNGIVKTGLKAEKWVDRWAEKTMKLYFPDIKYLVGYNEEGVKWYKDNYIPWFKDKLNDD